MAKHINEIINSLADRLYNRKVMNNSDRGNYVEQLVALALGSKWKPVGAGWHLWDFEGKFHGKRIRIQVKQSAARQLWVPKNKPVHVFSVEAKKRPDYILRDHPKEKIEVYGRFCEIFIFAWHGIKSKKKCDQRAPEQWIFYVVLERVLSEKKSIALHLLESEWLEQAGGRKTDWSSLREAVVDVIKKTFKIPGTRILI